MLGTHHESQQVKRNLQEENDDEYNEEYKEHCECNWFDRQLKSVKTLNFFPTDDIKCWI